MVAKIRGSINFGWLETQIYTRYGMLTSYQLVDFGTTHSTSQQIEHVIRFGIIVIGQL